jgi:CO/xanthine dehydrogenase Mo-binding subunit
VAATISEGRMSNPEIRRSQPGELHVVNQPLARHDAIEKASGSTRYAADLALPGMLHAKLVRSTFPSARLRRREISDALDVPGVVAILLGEDVPHNVTIVDVPGQQMEVRALRATSQVLATERVRYVGEPIALVVAETEEALTAAEAAIVVDYEELPGVFDVEAALADGAPPVHNGGNLLSEWTIDKGDVGAAFAAADVVVDEQYSTQLVDHAYLEPEAGVGWMDDDGVLTIRASTQVVEHFRNVARILGLPQSKVRLIAPYVGGGFGGKEDMTVEPYLGLAVMKTNRPVRMVWTRQESLLARAKRHPMRMHYRTAATKDGLILAHDIEILADSGAYAMLSALVLLYSSVTAAGPYRCDHMRLCAKAVYTNNLPTSAMRGFGAMQVVFGYESQIDQIARRLGIDRGEIRKRNALRPGDELPVGQKIETAVLLSETIDAVSRAAGDKPAPSSVGKRTGRGIASNIQPYGRLVWLNDSASAWLGFELDGSLNIRCGVTDLGGGQAFSLAQIAAEVLHVDLAYITVHFGDSARTPPAGTTTASRQLYMSGNAAVTAATMLREQVLSGVAEATGQPLSQLRLATHGIVGPAAMIPWPQALAMCVRMGQPIQALGTFFGPHGVEVGRNLRGSRVFPEFTFGTHLADVEVDMETGAVRVLNYIACHDVGRAINPQSVVGQIAGAVVQGLGFALSERVVVQEGVNLTPGFFQYHIPTALDVPDIKCILLESGEGLGPFGARGIGEAPIGPPAAAIASAIEDAIGVRPMHLPMLAERVLACVDTAKAQGDGSIPDIAFRYPFRDISSTVST